MDSTRFAALVASLEDLAGRDPTALRRRIKGLVALGYAYVLGILALVLAAIVTCVTIALTTGRGAGLLKLSVALAILATVIVRALWVRLDEPSGERLTAKQAPRLFARVEEIRRALRAPKPDAVILDEDFNAAVTQVPRFGVFGGHRTYLILGLPLLCAMGSQHLDAVLGHEFGHLSGAHPKYGLWVFRVRALWSRLLTKFHESGSVFAKLFTPFFRWYMPRLDAHGFALRRADEYAADRDGARAADPRRMAEALAILSVRGAAFARFWTRMETLIERNPTPPSKSWTTLPDYFREIDADPRAAGWMDEALARDNLVEDSHPALQHRLKALGALPPAPIDTDALVRSLVPAVGTSAATHYLGALARQRLLAWEERWARASASWWTKAHQERVARRAEVTALIDRDTADPPLGEAELWNVAHGLDMLDGPDAAEPWLERLLAIAPTHAGANFVRGRGLLERRDPRGPALIRLAMDHEPELIPDGNALLRRFHASVGDREAVARVEVEGDADFTTFSEARSEITTLDRNAELVAPSFTLEERRMLQHAASVPGVRALFAARRILNQRDTTVIVVLVEPERKLRSAFGEARARMTQQVLDRLESATKAFFVITWDAQVGWITRRMHAARGVRVDRNGFTMLRPRGWLHPKWRTIRIAAMLTVFLALPLGFLYLPGRFADRIDDPTGVYPTHYRRSWDEALHWLGGQTGVELYVVIDSFPAGIDFDELARDLARAKGFTTNRIESLLLVLDLRRGEGAFAGTPGLPLPIRPSVAERILIGHREGVKTDVYMPASIDYTLRHVMRALQERSLGIAPLLAARPSLPDSIRLVFADGTTWSYRPSDPIIVYPRRNPRLDSLLAPGATPAEALERFRLWASLPIWTPRARFLDAWTHDLYQTNWNISPAGWELLRHEYLGAPMHLEVAGDLAVAIPTDDPLAPPLYFHRTPLGWQYDAVVGLRHVQRGMGGAYAWQLVETGDPYDQAFRDRTVKRAGLRRYRNGANDEMAQ